MNRTATFDETGAYRYRLRREWDASKPALGFLMLNPSTADHTKEDPTVRRCIGFAKAWGYGALEVVNIFALRSTDPRGLRDVDDPIGPENDAAILECRCEVDMMIAAWGNHGEYMGRGLRVLEILRAAGPLHCLSLTGAGQPGHPLYLRADSTPMLII